MNHLGTKRLETERLILRKIEVKDAEPIFYGLRNQPEFLYYTNKKKISLEEQKEIFLGLDEKYKNNEYYNWVIELKESGELVGMINFHVENRNDSVEFNYATDKISEFAKKQGANIIVGPESRGFIFGCPVATKLNIGFVPVRKPGKLPRETVQVEYSLEYGKNVLVMHKDALKPGDKVVIVDDLLATGGTLVAAAKLIESLGGIVAGIVCVIELVDLNGRDALKDYNVFSILKY